MFGLFTNHPANLALAARELRLSHDGAYRLFGERDGIHVSVRLWKQQSGDNTHYYTTVEAAHPVPLRMSLNASREGSLGRFVRSALGGQDIATGRHDFDRQFHVRAHDPPRAVALLEHAGVRQAMLAVLEARRSQLSVTDTSASITIGGWHSDLEELRAMLNSVFPVAVAVRDVRAQIPASDAEKRAQGSLGPAAVAMGLSFDAAQLSVSGPRPRRTVSMRAVYQQDGGFITEFDVRFAESLNLSLRLLPQGGVFSAIGEFFGTQDVVVGHTGFDAAFKVKGQPEDKVRELLSGDVAARIFALRQVASDLEVTDQGVRATAVGLMDDTAALVKSLGVVDALAAAMVERTWGGTATPYR